MVRWIGVAATMLVFTVPAQAQDSGSLADTILDLSSQIFTGQRIELAKGRTPPADAYARALFSGYLELSQVEYDEGDYSDSDVFADRAIAATEDATFEPEAISARDLPTALLNTAATHRRNLLPAQLQGGRDLAPAGAAEAQVSFDCWMQEQDRQFEDIAACVNRFEGAMQMVNTATEAHLASLKQEQEPQPEMARLVTEVSFDLDSAVLTGEARVHIQEFAGWVKQFYKNPTVSVIGNSDQSGSDIYVESEGESYNLKLSRDRAEAVAAKLGTYGIQVDEIFARGDGVPVVFKVDRSPERANRRVIMIVLEN